ncbi:MAG: hypothetical protein ACI4C1_04635 [Lachnospiraceae bacterium]
MKEVTIVLNILEGSNGEILERTRTHYIKKNEKGLVEGVFYNRSVESVSYKFTLTGMLPGSFFELVCLNKRDNGKVVEHRRANSAGILEVKYIVPESHLLFLNQIDLTVKAGE